LLFGESGAGKSTFLIKLMEELLADPQFNNFLILFYKLTDLSRVEGSNGVIKTETQLK
jgi:GTPase SAR1 family protein